MQNHIYHVLPQTTLDQIEALHALCLERASGPALLGLVLPEADVREEDTFYALYYIEETPVSFLSCFCPDGNIAEISGFTHPEFRTRGFFSLLLKEAGQEARRLFGDLSFRFQCLSGDPDTAAFCLARGLSFSHGECMMEIQTDKALSDLHASLSGESAILSSIRLLPSADHKTLAALHQKIFHCPSGFAKNYIHTLLSESGTVSYLIHTGQKTVGLLHLTSSPKNQAVYLTGLGILPKWRQKGFAKATLASVFSLLPAESKLFLQVSTLNTAAFHLYEKLGFQVSSRLDYFSRL